MYLLNKVKLTKDMGAELFDNIRQGDWYIDYTVERLREYQAQEPTIGLSRVVSWMNEYFTAVKSLPSYLKPKYVSKIMEAVYRQSVKEIMGERILDEFMADSEDSFI